MITWATVASKSFAAFQHLVPPSPRVIAPGDGPGPCEPEDACADGDVGGLLGQVREGLGRLCEILPDIGHLMLLLVSLVLTIASVPASGHRNLAH